MTTRAERFPSLSEYYQAVDKALGDNPGWRYGQTLFNVLYDFVPGVANEIRGTKLDPYHKQDKSELGAFWLWLSERLN